MSHAIQEATSLLIPVVESLLHHLGLWALLEMLSHRHGMRAFLFQGWKYKHISFLWGGGLKYAIVTKHLVTLGNTICDTGEPLVNWKQLPRVWYFYIQTPWRFLKWILKRIGPWINVTPCQIYIYIYISLCIYFIYTYILQKSSLRMARFWSFQQGFLVGNLLFLS